MWEEGDGDGGAEGCDVVLVVSLGDFRGDRGGADGDGAGGGVEVEFGRFGRWGGDFLGDEVDVDGARVGGYGEEVVEGVCACYGTGVGFDDGFAGVD